MTEEIEKGVEKMSLNEKEKTSQKIKVDLKKYTIKSDRLKKKQSDFLFPTPEMLDNLFKLNIIKNIIEFDKAKYEKIIKDDVIDLSGVQNLVNSTMFIKIEIFLGAINSQNLIDSIFEIEEGGIGGEQTEDNFLENMKGYTDYIEKNKRFITRDLIFSDFDGVFNSLEEIGITFVDKKNNTYYKMLKDIVMSNNKIVVAIAPSNNFWIKSERSTINEINYDLKLNNYSKLFYNFPFIEKFLKKIGQHSRVQLALLCSMSLKNLKSAKEGLNSLNSTIKELLPKDLILIDQSCHDNDNEGKKNEKPKFYRNLNKIKGKLDSELKGQFSETSILIIESEPDKISEDTKHVSIKLNIFSEQYLDYKPEDKKKLDIEGDRAIEYIYNLLENCTDDIRDYLSKNPFNEEEK